ncbi:MAG: hypothetical protein L0229_23090 [Blastocatellia bacterium]|nr:hypothetical protein [Blastocatellia bacterium]
MIRSIFQASVLLAACALCWACGENGDAATSQTGTATSQSGASSATGLRFQAPFGWVEERPSSNMRVAQYRLPQAEGDSEDGSLVLYYFGEGQGGSVQANLDRWIGQMEQPDGGSSKEKATTETMTVNGLNATLLDVQGTYTAEMMPGGGDRHNKSNYRMRAAVVETPRGAYFVKLVGPANTISRWDQAYMSFIKSFEFK